MTYEPPSTPTGPGRVTTAPAAPPVPTAATTTPGPVAPATPDRTGLMGLTSDGNRVRVRPWSRANDVLAGATQLLLGLTAVAELVAAAVNLTLRRLVATQDVEEFIVLRALVDQFLWPITYVLPGAFVVFLVWLHRLWTSDRSAHNVYTRSTGIAVGGWFVPVANVVLGAYALRDLWHGTHNARRGVHDGPVDRSTPRLVTAWWLVALPAVLCAVVEGVLRVGLSAPASVESLLPTLELYLGVKGVGNALFAGAAVLLALVVGRITAFTRR